MRFWTGRHWQYLRYVLLHKWFVLVAGLRLGVPLWRLILHDWTKFLPCEWRPYVHFFYFAGMSRARAAALNYEYSIDAETELCFEMAWNHHQKRNDHHFQYWVRIGDDGSLLILAMPDVCRREMLADWRGAGRALGKPDTRTWYLANRDKMRLHPDTRRWIESQLLVGADVEAGDR